MTGLSGLELTSADGAQLRLTPHAASRRPSSRATALVRSVSSTAPRARLPGKEEPLRTSSRVTSPPSSSMATSTSGALGAQLGGEGGQLLGRRDVAAEQPDGGEPFADAAAAASPGALVPAKPGWSTASASRVRVSVVDTRVVMWRVIPSRRRR